MLNCSNVSNRSTRDEELDQDTDYDEAEIKWSDAIFIPFNPIFKLIVLVCVIHKTFLGPLQASFGITNCSSVMDINIVTQGIRYFYTVLANGIYFLDTLLHIVHRQVTDKAVRREHLPKSAFLIALDVISLVPFNDLFSSDSCIRRFWPNILSFTEFVIIYRVVQYFQLVNTHNHWKLYIGYTVTIIICVNCLTCLILLLTFEGLCPNCKKTEDFYDWRQFARKEPYLSDDIIWYFYAYQYTFSYFISSVFDETKPSTVIEFVISLTLVICGYAFDIILVMPKLFSESILSLRWISTYHPHVNKLIQETKRRNPSSTAYTSVHSFYNLMWNQRSGVIDTPDIINELPRYLRIDIRQDLIWQVFYHSPTLRRTSTPFKRYLCDLIRMDYKLPGARFFVGPQSNTNLYYLKTGIIQLISADDGSTPLLSVSGGTLFGDISFITYPMKRKIYVKCLTYCEILYVTRNDLLKSLHRYPNDRKHVLQLAEEKIRHARTLYNCKQNVKGLDRSEDEGINWLKRRWWEISDCVGSSISKKEMTKCEIPPEESLYHCAKYLGQLVLCSEAQLKKTSIFVNDRFPWVLSPKSAFNHVWQIFINLIVIVVLLTFPPNLSDTEMHPWFLTMKYFTDFVYIADIFVSLCTCVYTYEDASSDFVSVMLVRFKNPSFIMDVLAALWIEYITILIGKPEYFYTCQFNRLIKIHILFPIVGRNWSIGQDHFFPVYLRIFVSYFSFFYIISYITFVLVQHFRTLSEGYFYGDIVCNNPIPSNTECVLQNLHNVLIAIKFFFEYIFGEILPRGMQDIALMAIIYYHGYLLAVYCKCRFLACMYLNFREILGYQRFVTTLRNYYKHHTINESLLVRLERYLLCHWKYHHGVEVLKKNNVKDEPYDIYWKVQGEVAEKIIGESYAFHGADPGLVRELAHSVKYLIMPQGSTLFLFGVISKNITWIVQGTVKCEFHNEEGELQRKFYTSGDMITVTATILEKPSVRTHISVTDCEIIHIGLNEFKNIINKYPYEWHYLQSAIEEFSPLFDELNEKLINRHADYQRKMRQRILDARKSMFIMPQTLKQTLKNTPNQRKWTIDLDTELHVKPDSNFMMFWLPFRAATVTISIAVVALMGGGGVFYQWHLGFVKTLCGVISLIDIILKLFLAYYDEKGILVSSRSKTASHYITRGFTMDVIGFLPWDTILKLLLSKDALTECSLKLINTTSQFAHLYLVTGYFDYLADRPSSISVLIKIAKWQIVLLLLTIAGSHFLINSCVEFIFDDNHDVIDAVRRDTCWLPSYMVMDNRPTSSQLQMLYAHSINLAQSGYRNINLGKFKIKEKGNLLVAIYLFILGLVYWFVMAYSFTVVVLMSRTDTLFQHAVRQLRNFLHAERVESKLIKRTMAHFSYWWRRTKGVNIQKIVFERMGVILTQDLSYYFYKTTFDALDTILHGGEQFQRQLSSQSQQSYFLSKETIMKEMHLMPNIFVVHRGRVVVTQNGEKLAVLTKGAIFGQLSGTKPRPVKVSVHAEGYADVLHMTVKNFNEQLTDDIRKKIKAKPESKFDYMALKIPCVENPANTIKYILRGRKTIKLPWMPAAKEAHRGNWYYRWLYVVWLLGPATTAYLTTFFSILPPHVYSVRIWLIFILFDVVHLLHIIGEYYNMEITIDDSRCVYRRVGTRMFRGWRVYINIFSLVVPELSWVVDFWAFHFARLLRLYQFYDFYRNFCNTFKSHWTAVTMKFIILTLLIHSITCGWIHFACRSKFPVPLPVIPPAHNKTIDYEEWSLADQRNGGCARVTRNFIDTNGIWRLSFLVPNHWAADYLVALHFIIILLAHSAFDTVMQLSISQIYYKVTVTFIINLIDIWLVSAGVNAIYTKFRELYQYDFKVITMITYLERSGLSPSLTRKVIKYFQQLWDRQRGNWLPELAHQAPHCLRGDILGALYLHHILTPNLFRQLPEYFTEQLVARAGRVVIFPGRCIVHEGDINSIIYFIHEGEVEKWYNFQSPEKKFVALLSTNAYFGFIPGLFPNSRFQYTYASRTVVDLVYLRLKDWSDLLVAYPDVKVSLYKMAVQLKAKRGEDIKQDLSQPTF